MPPDLPPPAIVEVIDGDTLRLAGAVYRIYGMDAPETPRKAACAREAALGVEAARWAENFAGGQLGRVTRIYYRDRYGRTVADIEISNQDFRRAAIAGGKAQTWDYDGGEKKPDWCGS